MTPIAKCVCIINYIILYWDRTREEVDPETGQANKADNSRSSGQAGLGWVSSEGRDCNFTVECSAMRFNINDPFSPVTCPSIRLSSGGGHKLYITPMHTLHNTRHSRRKPYFRAYHWLRDKKCRDWLSKIKNLRIDPSESDSLQKTIGQLYFISVHQHSMDGLLFGHDRKYTWISSAGE